MDARHKALSLAQDLIKKSNLLLSKSEDRHITKLAASLITGLELIRNDLVLVFNQNFYLRCKLDEKTKAFEGLQKKVRENEEKHHLVLDMIRVKHEKQIQTLRFSQFLGKDVASIPIETCNPLPEQSPLTPEMNTNRKGIDQQKNCPSTINSSSKKCREAKSSLNSKFPQQKPQSKPYPPNSNNIFDLDVHGLLSQQKPSFSNVKVVKQMARSNEIEDAYSKKRRRAVSGKKEEDILTHRKKKSQELAQLINMQFKIPQIKEQYFSTDLL